MRRGRDGETERERDRQTDTQTRVTTIHFASATPHAKCNDDGDDWCAESGGITRAHDTHVESTQLPLPRRTTPDRSVYPSTRPVILRLHDTTGWQTGCTTGSTTGWMFVYTMQPVVQPD